MKPETVIHSNGSKWAGESPDSIEVLLDVLNHHSLDIRLFRQFITRYIAVDGEMHFFGNFNGVSHVFQIESNDPDVVRGLTTAIVRNILRQEAEAREVIRIETEENSEPVRTVTGPLFGGTV